MKRAAYFDGKCMRGARRGISWTLDDLARSSGVTKGYLSDLENGNQTNPALETLVRLASALGFTNLGDLVTRTAPRRSRARKATR